MQLSQHWNLSEFASRSRKGGPRDVPVPEGLIPNVRRLVSGALEPLRRAWGAPLVVVSGYRTHEYNRLVGGAPLSQHRMATAADIRPVVASPLEISRLGALVENMIRDGRLPALGGFGSYPTFLHLDVRAKKADGSIARWSQR